MGAADPDHEVQEQAKRAASWLLWLFVGLIVLAALIGLILLGPFGLAVAIPVVIIAVVVIGSSAGGPTAGA